MRSRSSKPVERMLLPPREHLQLLLLRNGVKRSQCVRDSGPRRTNECGMDRLQRMRLTQCGIGYNRFLYSSFNRPNVIQIYVYRDETDTEYPQSIYVYSIKCGIQVQIQVPSIIGTILPHSPLVYYQAQTSLDPHLCSLLLDIYIFPSTRRFPYVHSLTFNFIIWLLMVGFF